MPKARIWFESEQACVIVAPWAAKIEGVSKVSVAQKMLAVGRAMAQQARRSRRMSALMKGASAAGRAFGAVAHQLWLEVTGFVFLAMAGIGAIAMVREFAKYQVGHATAGRVAVAICFTVTFAWFGVTSFWRVRKKRS